MSEHRVADKKLTIAMPRVRGKIQHEKVPVVTVRLYGAYQFRKKHRRISGNFTPKVPTWTIMKERYYNTMFRVKIDGKWHGPGKCRYCFFTMKEVSDIVWQLMA